MDKQPVSDGSSKEPYYLKRLIAALERDEEQRKSRETTSQKGEERD